MIDPLFDVTGQVVLVSGGSRGIGRAIAAGFAQRGAKVIVTGRDQQALEQTEAEICTEGGTVRSAICDVTQPAMIDQLIEQTQVQFDRIDVLVNVAGVNRRKPALQVTEDDYDYVLDINLKGAFRMACAVGRHMVEREQGSIINITSLNNDRPLLNVTPYAMSKAGLANMTRSLALEWSPHGVRVNSLSPGFILTELTQKLWSDETMQEWARDNTPQRRLGQPEDLVGAAVFLASPAAQFITGQNLYVDGGFTAGWNWPIPEDNQ